MCTKNCFHFVFRIENLNIEYIGMCGSSCSTASQVSTEYYSIMQVYLYDSIIVSLSLVDSLVYVPVEYLHRLDSFFEWQSKRDVYIITEQDDKTVRIFGHDFDRPKTCHGYSQFSNRAVTQSGNPFSVVDTGTVVFGRCRHCSFCFS